MIGFGNVQVRYYNNVMFVVVCVLFFVVVVVFGFFVVARLVLILGQLKPQCLVFGCYCYNYYDYLQYHQNTNSVPKWWFFQMLHCYSYILLEISLYSFFRCYLSELKFSNEYSFNFLVIISTISCYCQLPYCIFKQIFF